MDISYVVTVYNKARYLPATIASLVEQDGSRKREYIFVDDCSTDDSLAVLRRVTAGIENVIIITNTENRGPSIRLNQGVRAASGRYVHLVDSDDILPLNASEVMAQLLDDHHADFIYGSWQKANLAGEELLGKRMPAQPSYTISTTPLATVLHGRYVRMALMVRRDLYLKANGCDERIFIQDESLPLRLAYHANSLITLTDAVVLVPRPENNLSLNKPQQHHDRMLAYYYALHEFSGISTSLRALLYRRCLSSAWKHIRRTKQFPLVSPIFFRYIAAWFGHAVPSEMVLDELYCHFMQLPNIRRMVTPT